MLVPLLDMLRQAGKKVFLATNSLWVGMLGSLTTRGFLIDVLG